MYEIYKITNNINGKSYIGQTGAGYLYRWMHHKSEYRGQKKKGNIKKLLFKAFEKYGLENFSVELLESNLTKNDANERETFYIDNLKTLFSQNGYNMDRGGFNKEKFSVELKKQMSEKKKEYYKKHPEALEKLRLLHLGTKMSEEQKSKISETLSERYKHQDHPSKGTHPHTDTWKKNHSEFMKKNFDHSNKERMTKITKALAKTWLVTFPDGHKESIVNMRQFCIKHNLTPINMTRVSQGILKQHKGYKCEKLLTK